MKKEKAEQNSQKMSNRKRNMILQKVLDRAHDDQSNMKEYLNKSMVEFCKQTNVSPHQVFSILFCLIRIDDLLCLASTNQILKMFFWL